MVESQTASEPGPGLTPPSFGPPSIPYVPPISLDDALVHARVTLRRRERRGGRLLVASLVALILPLIQAFATIFPADIYAVVPLSAYGFAAAIVGLYLFLALSAYRILTERPRIVWLVLPVGVLVAAFFAYDAVMVVQTFLDAVAAGTASTNAFLLSFVSPVCLILGGILALAAAFAARPRPVRTTMAG